MRRFEKMITDTTTEEMYEKLTRMLADLVFDSSWHALGYA